IWHRESDLWLMDLENDTVRILEELNSPEVESYHSWSSNGKWVVFSTRREDGAYTRLYLSHLNDNGSFSKPFALPQRDPSFNRKYMYSFNIPEFTIEPVHTTSRQFAALISGSEATRSKYESKKGE
ncbi:MAG: PD40 domain-containing protein, partial [Treponema sp.]|nr:PD40 domain-containing protein [Treponema sp.]